MKNTLIGLLFTSLLTGSAVADVTTVVSIRPLQLIAQSILGVHGHVSALVDIGQSPHHYTMSPSDRVTLSSAQLLVRIDPAFEVYLTDVFDSLGKSRTIITASGLQDIELHRDGNGELDPHVWLNTGNAVVLAAHIATEAARLDPVNADYFQRNLDSFRERTSNLDAQIRAMLEPTAPSGYLVYHNAIRYFEEQFGLRHGFVLLHNPDIEPNVQQILQAREYVKTASPKCLLAEPDANKAIIDTMLGGHSTKRITLDLLGAQIGADDDAYFQLLVNLAGSLAQCAR